MRQFSPILCNICPMDRQTTTFKSVQTLKYPKFTIHHSTTSHVCLITENESVRVEFSSLNLFNVEKIVEHNVVLLRVKHLRTYYLIDINRYYLRFASENQTDVFYETMLKLVHAPRPQIDPFVPSMSSQIHPVYPLQLDLDDEVIAADPSNASRPPQLNESVEEAMMPPERLIYQTPSVAPVRRGPVRVIRAPAELRRLRSQAETNAIHVNDLSTDEEEHASPPLTRQRTQQKVVASNEPEIPPKVMQPPERRGRPPKRKPGRPAKRAAAAIKHACSQQVAVSLQKKLKPVLKTASQPTTITGNIRRSARMASKPHVEAVAHVLDSECESDASSGSSKPGKSKVTDVDRNFSPQSTSSSEAD